MAEWLTQYPSSLQNHYVANHSHSTKPTDQPWFVTRCKFASDAKCKVLRCLDTHDRHLVVNQPQGKWHLDPHEKSLWITRHKAN